MTKTFLILFGLFFITFVYGQNHPKTLLWKVTKKGNKNESYLFGTFHEVSPMFFNSLSNAVNKLHESDILFVEERFPTMEQFTVRESPVWNFEKWQTILTQEQEDIFREFVEKVADTSCYIQSPLELLLGITRNYFLTFCETDTAFTELMDNHIERLGLKENKQVRSLDINHNTLINSVSTRFSKQEDSLYAVKCILGMKSTLGIDLSGCEFITAYRKFDIDYKFETTLTQNSVDKLLLIDRNNNWIAILDKAFSSSNCFVAVGFKHLCYKQGLIQQLRKNGYEVTPIPAKL